MELGELNTFVTVAAEHSFSLAAIVPRAVVSSRSVQAGLVVIPLSPARAASALTVVYRDNHGQPTAVEDFIEAVRISREDRTSRDAPIAMRIGR